MEMGKEGLQITEDIVKLTGLGAKNLAAIVIALLKEDNKLQGETKRKKEEPIVPAVEVLDPNFPQLGSMRFFFFSKLESMNK